MILLVHMLFGAAIGSLVPNVPLAILLAFLGHYFLDLFPHKEYSIKHLQEEDWRHAAGDALKVVIDASLAIILIFLSTRSPINGPFMVYLCAAVAIIPDALTIISKIAPNKFFSWHDEIHTQKIHYLTKKKQFPLFWKLFSQVVVIVISVLMLRG